MRGVILAGGLGSRLFPATIATSKQLLPVAGRPLCYFPLTTLMEAGIREVCVITTPQANDQFTGLLGDGSQWGMEFVFATQPQPNGLPEAFILGEKFIGREAVTLILGDNIFIGQVENLAAVTAFPASLFAARTANPQRYGVVRFDDNDRSISIKEKPKYPGSNFAVTGVYKFSPSVVEIAKNLKPSARGELEIVDVLNEYLLRGQLLAYQLPPLTIWLDCGTPEDLMEATNLIHALEKRTGEIIGSPEAVALRNGWITPGQFDELIRQMPECQYREALCQRNKNQNRATSSKH
jgi:glucose-1-phosphate thymidylyltransferase